ncbi:putative SRSF protein kinase 1 [Blattamonas nauphoetae]|uniref:non-specific serine/threonine protein kinase n=1 Tax=Blattamonas nauphoetae TaxID=2049346 RepID=A0ABQ9YCH4_9EUKA|nr:putative SRSF protein kinase 1 [Blattamonas nauphoetae]
MSETSDEPDTDYKPGGYHPVRIGDVYNQRYRVDQKLGWGHFSTVWFCTDIETDTHVAMKIIKSAPHYMEAAKDEIILLGQITNGDPENKNCVVHMLDCFELQGPNGVHMCMVFEALGLHILSLIRQYNDEGIPLPIVKHICKQILISLNYIHSDLNIIHTDIKPENILLQWPIVFQKVKPMNEPLQQDQSTHHGSSATQQPHLASVVSVVNPRQGTLTIEDLIPAGKKWEQLSRDEKERLKKKFRKKRNKKRDNNPQQMAGSPPERGMKGRKEKLPDSTTERIYINKSSHISDTKGIDSETGQFGDRALHSATSPTSIFSPSDNHEIQITPLQDSNNTVLHLSPTSSSPLTHSTSPALHVSNLQNELSETSPHSSPKVADSFPQPTGLDKYKIKLVDFGNACWTTHHFTSNIQTRQYRSPEVILRTEYDTSADIFSFGCLVFELLTGDLLFEPHSGNGYSRDEDHIALFLELLGPVKESVIRRGKGWSEIFTPDGRLRHIHELNYWPLRSVMIRKYGWKKSQAEALCDFLLPCLAFDPTKRPTAATLLQHPWLTITEGESGGTKEWVEIPFQGKPDLRFIDKHEKQRQAKEERRRRRDEQRHQDQQRLKKEEEMLELELQEEQMNNLINGERANIHANERDPLANERDQVPANSHFSTPVQNTLLTQYSPSSTSPTLTPQQSPATNSLNTGSHHRPTQNVDVPIPRMNHEFSTLRAVPGENAQSRRASVDMTENEVFPGIITLPSSYPPPSMSLDQASRDINNQSRILFESGELHLNTERREGDAEGHSEAGSVCSHNEFDANEDRIDGGHNEQLADANAIEISDVEGQAVETESVFTSTLSSEQPSDDEIDENELNPVKFGPLCVILDETRKHLRNYGQPRHNVGQDRSSDDDDYAASTSPSPVGKDGKGKFTEESDTRQDEFAEADAEKSENQEIATNVGEESQSVICQSASTEQSSLIPSSDVSGFEALNSIDQMGEVIPFSIYQQYQRQKEEMRRQRFLATDQEIQERRKRDNTGNNEMMLMAALHCLIDQIDKLKDEHAAVSFEREEGQRSLEMKRRLKQERMHRPPKSEKGDDDAGDDIHSNGVSSTDTVELERSLKAAEEIEVVEERERVQRLTLRLNQLTEMGDLFKQNLIWKGHNPIPHDHIPTTGQATLAQPHQMSAHSFQNGTGRDEDDEEEEEDEEEMTLFRAMQETGGHHTEPLPHNDPLRMHFDPTITPDTIQRHWMMGHLAHPTEERRHPTNGDLQEEQAERVQRGQRVYQPAYVSVTEENESENGSDEISFEEGNEEEEETNEEEEGQVNSSFSESSG